MSWLVEVYYSIMAEMVQIKAMV